MGLRFSRSYNSGLKDSLGSLGYGWNHNHQIFLTKGGGANRVLGQGGAVDAAALITYAYITKDVFENLVGCPWGNCQNYKQDLLGQMVNFLSAKWIIDQMIDNTITIHIGSKSIQFLKQPDGTYSGPVGNTAKLIDNNNGTFTMLKRNGTRWNFDTNNRLSQLVDADGNAASFTYDDIGSLIKVNDAFDRQFVYTYADGLLISVIDSAGRSIAFGYNEAKDLTTVTDPAGKIWSYEYDSQHRLKSLIDPLGITKWTNTYNKLDQVVQQQKVRQNGTTIINYKFTGFRNVEEHEDGYRIIHYFDNKGRPISTENSHGHRAIKTYDGQGNIIKTTDVLGNSIVFNYDANSNLVKITDALGKNIVFTYDDKDRLINTTNPLGHSIKLTYNESHHVTSDMDPLGNNTISAYFENGLKRDYTDPLGVNTSLNYDLYGNLATEIIAPNPPISYEHDSIGNLTRLTDQAGASTTFEYDPRRLLTKMIDPNNQSVVYTYDDAGRLETRTDRNGDTISYTHTPNGLVENITLSDASSISFSYDKNNNILAMTDAMGSTQYIHNTLSQLTSVTDPHGFLVSYAYDAAGNLTKLTYPGGKSVHYAYNAKNQLITVTNWLGQIATYTYDAAGRKTSLENFNGTLTTYSYDEADRLTGINNRKSGGDVIASYQFTLDASGKRTNVTVNQPLDQVFASNVVHYTHNSTKNRLLSANEKNYRYDQEGQLIGAGNTSFTFDVQGRIAAIEGDQSIRYSYDGADRRLQRIVDGHITRYIYDVSGNLLAEADKNNKITRYYIHSLGLLAAVTPYSAVYSYHYDGTGNTVSITDDKQDVINQYAYTPFGTLAGQAEQFEQPFKMVGKYGVMAEPNDYYYMRARYYDPKSARFISQDPIGFDAGDVNLYAYVGNNPIDRIDPEGKEAAVCGDGYELKTVTMTTMDKKTIDKFLYPHGDVPPRKDILLVKPIQSIKRVSRPECVKKPSNLLLKWFLKSIPSWRGTPSRRSSGGILGYSNKRG